jgi:hypothetical protein
VVANIDGSCRGDSPAIPGIEGNLMLRRFATAMALATALIVPLAGCSANNGKTGDAKASPTPSPSPKPADLLSAALTKTRGVSLKLTLGDANDQLSGVYDATKKMVSVEGTENGETMTVVITEADLYMAGLKEFQGRALHLKIAKFQSDTALLPLADPLFGLSLLGGATAVESPSPNFFQGTLDLSKVTAPSVGTQKLLEITTRAASGQADAIQFNAKVDAQGYITEFNTTLPKIDDGNDSAYNETFSDFGSPVTVTVPTSKVIEAPDSAYKK